MCSNRARTGAWSLVYLILQAIKLVYLVLLFTDKDFKDGLW